MAADAAIAIMERILVMGAGQELASKLAILAWTASLLFSVGGGMQDLSMQKKTTSLLASAAEELTIEEEVREDSIWWCLEEEEVSKY